VTTLLATTAFVDGSYLFSQLLLSRQEQTITDAKSMANHTESTLDSWFSQLIVMTNGLAQSQADQYQKTIDNFTKSHPDFVGFLLVPEKGNKALQKAITAYTVGKDDPRYGDSSRKSLQNAATKAITAFVNTASTKKKSSAILNLAPATKLPLIATGLSFSMTGDAGKVWAFMVVWQTRLVETMISEDKGFVAVKDKEGNLITSNSLSALLNPKTAPYTEETASIRKNSNESGFREWKTGDGDHVFGSWGDIKSYSLRIFSFTSGAPVYQALELIIKRSVLLAVFVTLLSIMVTYYAASSTTKHLKALMNGAMEIARGNFKSRVTISSRDEVGILGQIVNYMSVELENFVLTRTQKAKLESELDTARTVQAAFIPDESSLPDNFRVKAFYQPADACGGDWWGHFPINENLHLVAIADATGHGIPAALVTAMIYSMTSMAAKNSSDLTMDQISPARMLESFNKSLCAHGSRQHTLTCFLVIFDLRHNLIKFANAGHNLPLFYQAEKDGSGLKRKSIQAAGNPLGLDAESTYSDRSQQLGTGDKIILYTDGLIECTDSSGDAWDKGKMQRLLKTEIVNNAEDICGSIVTSAFEHFAGFPLKDDITLVVMEILERKESDVEFSHLNELDETA
jgi:serine phosphatase RsbU (regulator of sigma subunit)